MAAAVVVFVVVVGSGVSRGVEVPDGRVGRVLSFKYTLLVRNMPQSTTLITIIITTHRRQPHPNNRIKLKRNPAPNGLDMGQPMEEPVHLTHL